MISYNNRYRGQIEYEKMLINILQFSNMVNCISNKELMDSDSNLNNLKYIEEQLLNVLNELTENNGVSERIYMKTLMNKGVPYDTEIN